MSIKKLIKKTLNYILTPRGTVHVSIAQINHGNILKGKKILITGGGSGLGLAMAQKFANEGAKVLIIGRNEDRLKTAVTQIGNNSKYIQFDVTEVEKSYSLLEQAKKLLGGADCLVCNAGLSLHEGNISNVTVNGYDKQMNVNLRANYFLCQAFIEQFNQQQEKKQADILLISSMTGNQSSDIPYGITKAGINSMVQKLNRDNYTKGLRVNAIAPGMVPTELTRSYIDVSDGNMYCRDSCGRYFKPEEIAEVATFLLSDAARIIGGEVITCDGGLSQKTIWK